LEELPYVILVSIVTFISWIDYRKKAKKAESEEEIRKALVPFILVMVLFLTSISVFLT
jgi:heme/copper-type cytochrome/quinol oxidase subunit 2